MASGREKLFIICVAAAASLIVVTEICRRRRQRAAAVRRCCSEFEEKPQSRFKRVLADNSYSPFKHYKREGKEKEMSLKVHPYEEEISSLLANPPSVMKFVSSHDLVMGDSYIWIHTEDQLQFLASSLSNEHIFSVDTEQHSFRSFLGFTALMQISTQNDDFLLDTIALHDAMSILRPVFADPSICKVFHGADNDVLWLQRDFHIYVVNLFDTAKACEVLSKPQKSLAYLLETYCGVSTDKTFQREDWRIRPLSAEMIKYARTDAHYLLFIADCLASELRKENEACPDDRFSLFFEAIRRSNMVCMQLYAKDIESTPGASSAASIYSRNLHVQENISMKNSETKELVWKLCAWRDLMARIHDESLRYVLSDQAIPCLAAEAPKTPRGVLSVIQHADLYTDSSNATRSPSSESHIVSAHVDELCFLLHTADSNINDIFKRYLQKRLDPAVCCPISIYNYALLSEFSIKRNSTLFSKQNGRKLNAPVGKKASRELFVQKFSCKAPVYHNCRIYANDGRLLCYCDRRKLEWYVRRNLAKVVEDDPPAIMLLFEPKGRPEDEDNDFYIQSKKNICVGCGEKNHYLRYRIIPSCYRVHFPEHLKSHRSHDIVLLCVDCHEIAHTAAEKYKRQVAAEFGIPLFVRKIVDLGESKDINTLRSLSEVEESGVSPLQLRTAAMALLRHGSTMPSKRHDELMQIVQAYFGGREISSEDLEMALLVGMSPHEIRRLEKKKGLNCRRYKDNNFHLVSNMQTKGYDNNSINIIHNSKGSSEDEDTSDIDIGQANTSMDDVDVSLLPNGDNLATDSIETLNDENNLILNHGNGYGNPSDEISRHDQSSESVQVISSKSAKKLSLLGHGPHGRQVVELLLRNYGEDGICEFCQRWRQVFVEAVHPRFLPSGWDVMHSGRRDFGDYSVYNPAKRTQKVE